MRKQIVTAARSAHFDRPFFSKFGSLPISENSEPDSTLVYRSHRYNVAGATNTRARARGGVARNRSRDRLSSRHRLSTPRASICLLFRVGLRCVNYLWRPELRNRAREKRCVLSSALLSPSRHRVFWRYRRESTLNFFRIYTK